MVFIGSGHVDGLVKSFKKINPNPNTFIFGKLTVFEMFFCFETLLDNRNMKAGNNGPSVCREREGGKKTLSVFVTLQLLTKSDVLENADCVGTLGVLLELCNRCVPLH